MESEIKVQRKQNPRERTNLLSAVLFIHMVPTFWKFYKRKLREEDLYDALDEHKSNKLGNTLEALWIRNNTRYNKAALFLALFQQFGFELSIAALATGFGFLQSVVISPTAVNGLMLYFKNDPIIGNTEDGYYYAGMLCFSLIIRVLIGHYGIMMMCHVCMKMRVACCSLIYRKALKLSATALSQTTIGQIVNLLSNDVSKFDQGLVHCPHIFVGPLSTAIAIYQLYGAIGVPAFSGITFLLLFVPLQIFLGKLYSRIRLKTAVRTDERLRLLNEIFSGINVIKMYTWETYFAKLVSVARRYEMKSTRARFYIEGARAAIEMFATRTSIFITIVVFVLLENNITVNTAFYITAIYTTLRSNVGFLFPVALNSCAEVYVSICRIQSFLKYDELQFNKNCATALSTGTQNDCNGTDLIKKEKVFDQPKIVLKDVNVKWIKELPNYALQDVHLNIHNSQLVALIGPVGSGKSTLLNLLLKEIKITSGVFEINGKISFSSQEPWLFSATVRQNILFGNEYNGDRYKTVLSVCALEADLKNFPFGDQTILSESGKSLSGGQKARINLARCIYREADIYLLDDPLSAVDVEVGNYLYGQCIQHFLKDKICILVTHQLQYLKDAHKIIIMNGGHIVGDGSYDELQKSGLDFSTLLKEFCPTDEQEKVVISDAELKTDLDRIAEKNAIIYQQNKTKETTMIGDVGLKTYFQYFRCGGGYFKMCCVFLLIFVAQIVGISGDYFVSYWVTLEQTLIQANSTNVNSSMTRKTIISIYSGITVLTILLAFGNGWFFFTFLTRASVNMHNSVFEKITCATMRFFDVNPTGRILNRFSKDLGIIDEYIPLLLMDVLKVFAMFVSVEFISGLINPLLMIPLAILWIPLYISARIYIKLANSAKRIEGITRSPLFTHMSATINGLPTIRACATENKLLLEFDAHQDLHSSAWYLFISASRAYAFWLDLLTTLLLSTVIVYFLTVRGEYASGEIGLIITQYMYINLIFSYGMRQICELENNMVSVERVIEYTKVELEPNTKPSQSLPKNWPENGKVEYRNVSMRYILDGPVALKNLNITFCSKEKIGIVGRTGAGKSSIVAALFQMYNTEGNVLVDNVDVTKMSRKDLRSKISIIPQHPVLFSGTIRKNLDPMEQYDDNVLWSALEQVELKEVIENLPGGLSTHVLQSGANFSTGIKQLICFARAIVRRNSILVMDEATANVDPHTDSVIQQTIRKTFADCTVLIIAHRLHTVINCDKILVMDDGSVVEFDTPYNLLGTNSSIFYKMVQAAGEGTVKRFFAIAETNFKKQL